MRLVDEWTQLNGVGKKKARQHLRDHGVQVPLAAGMASIGPVTIKQLNLFAHKMALDLYFEHFRTPFPATGKFCAFWKTKEDLARGIPSSYQRFCLPTVLRARQMERSKSIRISGAVNTKEGLFGFLAKLRGGLFVAGFLVIDISVLPAESRSEDDWISPMDPQALVELPRFSKKL